MKHNNKGKENEHWSPRDPDDIAFLKMAEGSTFEETTFPSGWVSPSKVLICRNGNLYNKVRCS